MQNEIQTFDDLQIHNKIFTIRGVQVMLDRDLAELYHVETKRLNEQVKRNINRPTPKIFIGAQRAVIDFHRHIFS